MPANSRPSVCQEEPPPGSGVHRMVATLNFAGNVTGIFNVQLTVDFGRVMAAALLDMGPDEVDPGSEVRDLLAEKSPTSSAAT